MKRIIVNAYAVLRDILGSNSFEVSTSATTVREFIEFLSKRHGELFQEKLVNPETNTLQRSYKILLNGRNIDTLDGLMTRIQEGDKIIFFPPVGGG